MTIPEEYVGKRFDQVASCLIPDFSRARIQQWIKAGQLLLNGKQVKAKEKVATGASMEVLINLKEEGKAEGDWQAQAMVLDIVYEDNAIIIVNKPVNLVVHPAVGNPQGTLLNGLLHHAPVLRQVPRAGIVHRLDKDTTGLLVVAKTLTAHHYLVAQLQQRAFVRQYEAIVSGEVIAGSTIDAPIGRDPKHRTKMAVNRLNGKVAITHYRIAERYQHFTHLQVRLETGRTHQIRVHLRHIHHPIVGDSVYAGRLRIPAGVSETLREALRQFPRQALHASRLGLTHPVTGEFMQWQVPMPDDMQQLCHQLAKIT